MDMSFKTWLQELMVPPSSGIQQKDMGEPEDEKALDDVKKTLATAKGPNAMQQVGQVLQKSLMNAKSPEGIAKVANLKQQLGISNMKKHMKKKMKKR